MRVFRVMLAMVFAWSMATTVMAAEYQWLGVGSADATSYDDDDVDDGLLWKDTSDDSTGVVPGTDDTAIFDRRTDAYAEEVIIPAGSVFAPTYLQSLTNSNNQLPYCPVYLLKDMSLDTLTLQSGTSSGGQGDELICVGSSAAGAPRGYHGYAWVRYYFRYDGPGGAQASYITDTIYWNGTITITGPGGSVTSDTADYGAGSSGQSAFLAAVNADTATHGVGAGTGYRTVYLYTAATGSASWLKVDLSDPVNGPPFEHFARPADGQTFYGIDDTVATLTLTGNQPLDLGGAKGSWRTFWLAQDSKLVFTGDPITFQQMRQDPNDSGPLQGESGTSVEFTAASGTVNLSDPGDRTEGSIAVQSAALKIRSDQTWTNTSGLGYVWRTVGLNETLIEAIDAQPLDNLDEINFYANCGNNSFADASAVTIPAGEYGGLRTTGDLHYSTRYGAFKLAGNAALKGYAVTPGDDSGTVAAADPDYSLYLLGRRYYGMKMLLDGNTLDTTNGVILVKVGTGSWRSSEASGGPVMVDATGSTLNIGGDLEIKCQDYWMAGWILSDVLRESRKVGIVGDATTVVNIGGSFTSNARSMSAGYDGLTAATVNLLGGSVGAAETFEVMADPTTTTFDPGTSAIGTLNVGAAGDDAYIQLVNDQLNDNDEFNLAKVKDGEVLLVGSLNIVNGTLDCNGLGITVSNATLSIAADGTLDLTTGGIEAGEVCLLVAGLEDQTAAWDTFKDKVIDSDTPGMGFEPLYVAAFDATFWAAKDAAATGTIQDGSLVVATPDRVANNGDAAIVTVVLRDTGGFPVTGLSDAAFSVAAGSAVAGTVTETGTGIYTFALTDTTAETVNVAVTASGTLLTTHQPQVEFYVPGTAEDPAYAGVDQTINDAVANYAAVTLDGSGSYNTGDITNYHWELDDGQVLYDGVDASVNVAMLAGVNNVILTVTYSDSSTYDDTTVVTINLKAYDTVALDISAGFNHDVVGTVLENSKCLPIYNYWLASTPPDDPNWLERERVTADGTGNLDRRLWWWYNDPLNPIGGAPGYTVDEFDQAYGHHSFSGWDYSAGSYVHDPDNDLSLQPTVATGYANYELGPFDAGEAALADTTVWTLPATPNCVHVGTGRGKHGYWEESTSDVPPADPDPTTRGYAKKVVMLPGDQQQAYQDVNFLVAGQGYGNTDQADPWLAEPRGWFRVYAIYDDGAGGQETALIFHSPAIQYRGDPLRAVAGAVPGPGWDSTTLNAAADAGYLAVWDGGYEVSYRRWDYSGSNPAHSTNVSDICRMWETGAAGCALNPAKTLLGFHFEVDNGTLAPAYEEGDEVHIFAASATPAGGAPLEITAALAAGEEWVYQNTQTTTADRHTSLATITLVSEASPGETYVVSIADDGPVGGNFTLGAVVDNRPGEQTLTVPIVGGRIGASTPGAGGAAYTVTLTVEGQTSTETDTADVSLALRYIGDVDGSGAPGAQDKQFFNQRLNNVATAYPDRCYDLNGSGGAPNAEDKQVMNQVLNGVSLP